MNEITVTRNYAIESLDNAIKEGAEKVLNISTSTKEFALAMGRLKVEHDKHDVVKNLKFPEWVDSLYAGRCAGQTAYKYAQVAIAFSGESFLWDVLTLSKMSILLNTRTASCKDAVQATYNFFAWYGDMVNRRQNDRWNAWNVQNSAVLDELRKEGISETVRKSLESQLTKEPKKGITTPEEGANEKEYADICIDRAYSFLANIPDKALLELVRMYRNPSDYILTDKGFAEKVKVVTTDKPTSKESKSKTPDELKAEALTALEAYIATLTDVPKTLKGAIMVLSQKGGEK